MLKGKHVVITGASSGIGAALVRELSAAGAKITLVARRKAMLEALAAELPGPTFVVTADLATLETGWLSDAEAALGPIDVLVNNAGLQVIGPTDSVDIEKAEASIAVNLTAPLRLIHSVLPGMRERGGTIVNITSLAALAPTPSMTWYNATKGGLAAASEALRGELLDSKVRVITVYPGIIHDTAMAQGGLDAYEGSWAVAMQPTSTAPKLAVVLRKAIERGKARVIYPKVNTVVRWLPATTRWLMDRFAPPVHA